MRPLSPHPFSGRHLPHHHTSYAALLFLSLVAGVMLLLATQGAIAGSPQTGQVDISAVVHGAAPTQAPTITDPVDQQHLGSTPVPVSGTCIVDYKVVIFKNDVMAGSGICKGDGTFNIKVDLFFGRNELKARQYDFLDQASPDSGIVVVFYDLPPPTPVPSPAPGAPGKTVLVPVQQLELRTDSPYKTGNPADEFIWPLQVLGGTPPYAISWNWGDGSVDVVSMTSAGTYTFKHTYQHPGNYRIVAKGSDSKGQTASLELLAIVNGQGGAAVTKNIGFFDGGLLLILWPLYFLMITMLVSFWMGERYEFYKVKQRLLGYRGPFSTLKP